MCIVFFYVKCFSYVACVRFEFVDSPEVTLCGWWGCKPSINKQTMFSYFCARGSSHPDMTFVVDWVLKPIIYLSRGSLLRELIENKFELHLLQKFRPVIQRCWCVQVKERSALQWKLHSELLVNTKTKSHYTSTSRSRMF